MNYFQHILHLMKIQFHPVKFSNKARSWGKQPAKIKIQDFCSVTVNCKPGQRKTKHRFRSTVKGPCPGFTWLWIPHQVSYFFKLLNRENYCKYCIAKLNHNHLSIFLKIRRHFANRYSTWLKTACVHNPCAQNVWLVQKEILFI